jgi:hypothetical protein
MRSKMGEKKALVSGVLAEVESLLSGVIVQI